MVKLMKKIILIEKCFRTPESMNRYITPEKQSDFLKKHGHLEGVVGCNHYYTSKEGGYRVIILDGKAVQIIRMSKPEVLRIVSCANLKFGDF